MDSLYQLADLFLHVDKHLAALIAAYGIWTYAILFVVIFCETGLVVTPFLPGDSLLFAAGALAAGGGLNVYWIALLLIAAAILGDATNYTIGAIIGQRVYEFKDSRIFKREYLERTQKFFDKYGGAAIMVARFAPIVRTFAPFLAGVGKMRYLRFAMFNVVGGALWVSLFIFGGYLFGGLPVVKNNFTLVIVMIVLISLLPIFLECWRARKESKVLKTI